MSLPNPPGITDSPLHRLHLPGIENSGTELWVKRDDLIHPVISGNKWRKLKPLLELAESEGKTHLVTFGGAYSNHVIATACAAALLGLKSSAFIRGDEGVIPENHYTMLAGLYGMQLIPVSRTRYRDKELLYTESFGNRTDTLMIGEGGAHPLAEKGAAEIVHELPWEPDYIICASGTGTTATGIARGVLHRGWKTQVLGIHVLKGFEPDIPAELSGILSYNTGFHEGGYARTSPELFVFIKEFISATGILIDPVYTAKSAHAAFSLIQSGHIPSGSKVVWIHTGGTLGLFSTEMQAEFRKSVS